MKEKRIVMVDLDGVVLNSKYQTTKNIQQVAGMLGSTSYIVPNSDTPVERLAMFFRQSIGVDSDIIIGENGAVVKHFGEMHCTHLGINTRKCIQNIKSAFTECDCTILECDAPILVRGKQVLAPNTKFILIDKFRRMSVSMFFLITDRYGILRINQKWSDICLRKLEACNKPNSLSEFVYNPKYGIAISSVEAVSKTFGYLFLRQKYPDAQFFMIGDSNADIIEDEEVIHLSVNNASRSLKSRAKFVASCEYTAGLEQCFEWVLKEYVY